MKNCGKPVKIISNKDIEWFYKISPDGLAMQEQDLHMILEDTNMPKDVTEAVKDLFPELKRKKRFGFV